MKKAAAILLSTLFASQAHADRWVNIDMEQWGINCPGPSGAHAIQQDGNIFKIGSTTKHSFGLEGNYQCPWITGSASYAGAKALAIWLKPTPDWKSRSEVRAIHYDDAYALKYGRIRYLGFAMYINNTASDWPLEQPVHFMQAWEGHTTCSPGAPPLAGTLIAGGSPGSLRFYFHAKYDEIYSGLGHTTTGLNCGNEIVASGPMAVGKWHRFVMKLAPNHAQMSGTGQVTIWHGEDDEPINWHEPIANWVHDWGSVSDPSFGGDWLVTTGAYRPDVAGTFSTTNLVMLFDNIRVASTWEEAIP